VSTTSKRFRTVVVLYTVLGATLSAVGALTAWLSNAGAIPSLANPVARVVVIALGLALLAIGTHIAIAGLASLRSR
jgi:sulfite exporter TauE/SafE